MRRWLRPLWIVLALLFLVEAWLWDHLAPIIAWVVRLVPLERFKAWLKNSIGGLPPWATLLVFVVPIIAMLPFHLVEAYFLATGNWFGAIGVIVFVKLFGLAVTAFIFDVTRDKLLQMAWFLRLYEWMLWLRETAHAITAPLRQRIRKLVRMVRPQRAGRFFRLLTHLRRAANRRRLADKAA